MSKLKPKKNKASTTSPQTATTRRSTQGLMLFAAVVAAVGIVVILNYVVYWQYRGLSPDTRQWVRYDLTATRQYSLSDQSKGVIASLDKPYRVVTMLGGESVSETQAQRIRDLTDEYARASSRIEPLHIDLETQAERRDELLAEIDAMFAEDTADIRASIAQGLAFVANVQPTLDQITKLLGEIVDSPVKLRPASIQSQRLADLHGQYLRLQDQREQLYRLRDLMLGQDWQTRLRSPGEVDPTNDQQGEELPDYGQLMAEIQRYVIQLTRQTLLDTPGKADQLRRGVLANASDGPRVQQAGLEAQNTLASLVQQVPQLTRQLTEQSDPLLRVIPPRRYDQARAILNDRPCVLITSGSDARVIPAERLFRGAAGQDTLTTTSDLFVGEEQLTGALISMSLDPPPLVVFIRSNTGQRAFAIDGPDQDRIDGAYDFVAQRLLAMDFDVAEWTNPTSSDPPSPKPGQRVVWITMPYLKPDPARSESLDNTRKDFVAEFIAKRLDLGDSAMIMLSYNPDTDPELRDAATDDRKDPAAPDTLIALLDTFGLDAQVYQNATRLIEEAEDPAESIYGSAFLVEDWPDDALVGRSLEGIDTYFLVPMPIALKPVDGVTQQPLVELNAPAMYVQRTVPDRETGSFSPEPGSERERVLIGAAAQRDEARIVAIGDATWALDRVTSIAVLPDGKSGPNLADQPGAKLAYPGNTDLFVAAVCWLAHEEALIAASPRTRDTRRIDRLSPAGLQAARIGLLGVLPAAIFAVGIVVWLSRRRA